MAAGNDKIADRDVTQWLDEMRAGHPEALDQLVTLLYQEIRRIAHGRLRHERADHTLGTTALVNEVYFKLRDQRRLDLHDRNDLLGFARQKVPTVFRSVPTVGISSSMQGLSPVLRLTMKDGKENSLGTPQFARRNQLPLHSSSLPPEAEPGAQ